MSKRALQQYAKILYHITKNLSGKELDRAVLEFFYLLKKRQVLKKIDRIIEHFLNYVKDQEGIDTIMITSAYNIPGDIAQEMAHKFSDHFELSTQVDRQLLGGVRVKKGNTVYDASLAAQLKNMHEVLSK